MKKPAAGEDLQPSDWGRKPSPEEYVFERSRTSAQSGADTPLEDDLREVLRVLWRRKLWIVASIVTVMGATLMVLPFVPPRYTAEAFVQIDPRETNIIDIESVVSGISGDSSSILGEVQVIQSRGLARATIEFAKLSQYPELSGSAAKGSFNPVRAAAPSVAVGAKNAPAVRARDRVLSAFSNIGKVFDNAVGSDGSIPDSSLNGKSLSAVGDSVNEGQPPAGSEVAIEAVNRFLARLTVAPVSRSNVVAIKFVAKDPRLAAVAVNVLSDLYIEAQLAAKYAATDRAAAIINERLESLELAVEGSEKEIEDFRGDMGLIDGVRAPLLTEQVSRVGVELAIARSALAEAEARIAEVEAQSSRESIDHIAEVLGSPVITQLRDRQSALSQRYSEASNQYGLRHPIMQAIIAEVTEIQQEIRDEIGRLVKNLAAELRISSKRVASLEQELETLEAKAVDANRAGVRVRTLEREAEANRNLYQIFLARYKETTIQEGLLQPDARVVSYADLPTAPSQPDKKLLAALALVASSLLGLTIAFIIERLDSSGLRSAEQVESALGLSVIGFVPMLMGRRGRTHPADYFHKKPHSAFAESIRGLQTSLLLSQPKTPVTIAVTSSIPEEGKTTLSLTLARAMASTARRVVLVDCDLRRPGIHRATRRSNDVGVSDYLSAEAPLETILSQDNASDAYVILAGRIEANSAELFRSDRMTALLETLRNNFDYVILDCPPLLPVSDGRILSSICDLTIFLVRWRTTRREIAGNGMKLLREAGAVPAGAVITQVNVRQHALYSFGDSGYYYGKYQGYYSDKEG